MSLLSLQLSALEKIIYRCSCTICGWQGSRALKSMRKPCPKCKSDNVYPNNPRVNDEHYGPTPR